MKQNSPSVTAYKVAVMRAAHQLIDNPKIFQDPIALRIVGRQAADDINRRRRKFKTKLHSHLRAIVVARSRFAEDELSAAIKRGLGQYVILGAGLDTFAYRNPCSAKGLKIFEVDHPATQAWKRILLEDAGMQIPPTLAFVPLDLENQSLSDQLPKAGSRTDQPCFFAWLGVTMYLSPDAVRQQWSRSSHPPL